jgi:hexosaminidase
VACVDAEVAPIVERFCAEVARRSGLDLRPVAGSARSGAPAVRVEVGARDGLDSLPAPAGLFPAGEHAADERHSLAIDGDGVVVRAVEPVGVARGRTPRVPRLATAPSVAGEIPVPGGLVLDAPRYAWRGLSLDLARTFFTLEEVRRVVDLLALYKLNVLHLHLTDDQSWRLPVGRSEASPPPDAAFYAADDLRALAAYAGDRFVTVVPEVDTPGHTAALVHMHPGLATGHNEVEFELPGGHVNRTAWLDPELPATFALVEEVLAGVAGIFPGPYVHIGGDEPHGMPHDRYAAYVRRVREVVRGLGRRPLGWQESARAGLGTDDVIQYWFSDIALPASVPARVRARLDADLARSRQDVDAAVAASVPVIVSPLSHCYLDVPYAEPPDEPAQEDRRRRVGLRLYPRRTVEAAFDWEPAAVLGPGRSAHVAGVEATVWAETISGFDDLCFLLLPRLPGVAQRAWGAAGRPVAWPDHRARLARHGALWAQDDLTYFRTSAVDWRQP